MPINIEKNAAQSSETAQENERFGKIVQQAVGNQLSASQISVEGGPTCNQMVEVARSLQANPYDGLSLIVDQWTQAYGGYYCDSVAGSDYVGCSSALRNVFQSCLAQGAAASPGVVDGCMWRSCLFLHVRPHIR